MCILSTWICLCKHMDQSIASTWWLVNFFWYLCFKNSSRCVECSGLCYILYPLPFDLVYSAMMSGCGRSPESINAVACSTPVYSLIGASMLRTGWSQSPELLSQACLVIKVSANAAPRTPRSRNGNLEERIHWIWMACYLSICMTGPCLSEPFWFRDWTTASMRTYLSSPFLDNGIRFLISWSPDHGSSHWAGLMGSS